MKSRCQPVSNGTTTYFQSQCIFTDYSASIHPPPSYHYPSNVYQTSANVIMCTINKHEVMKRLARLYPSKGYGPDGIPPSVLTGFSNIFVPHTKSHHRPLQYVP
ncbi:hypothetical protein J6590_051790 [Homalodisca vitripennis]|nr:hypothetical protein J6590_051790 [Homalodisca vitripennis]